MPSINRPPSLTIGLRRADIAAFWILATAMSIVTVALVSAALGVRAPAAWGAIGLALPLPGLMWRQWFELGVRAWNKSVRSVATVLRAYVLKVCYYVLFGPMSGGGSTLDLERKTSEMSRWISRPAHASTIDEYAPPVAGSWRQGIIASIRKPGDMWMVLLMPVMFLLVLLRDQEQETAPPSSTYTLY